MLYKIKTAAKTGVSGNNNMNDINRIDKNQKWKMNIRGTSTRIQADVPGSVYNDMIFAGLLEDPYWRDNEDKALELMKNDFVYTGEMEVAPEDIEASEEVILRFEGLDTIAVISLNGEKIGSANNMHRTWDFSVKELLKAGKNQLEITFASPVKFIAEEHKKDPGILGTEDAMKGFPKIRKGHYMFGWDWGPRLPDAGIWKEVKLLKVNKCRLERVYIHQEFNEDLSEAFISIDLGVKGNTDANYRITVVDPEGAVIHESEKPLQDNAEKICIKNPKLWWPNGLGEQPLYSVRVQLIDTDGNAEENADGDILDVWDKRIGLRKMSVSTAKDEYGSEFAHMINNVKFFAMGADYIPEDNILSRTNYERTRNLLMQCKAANFNCIRVWGGGLYPSDDFYDICDELGLVVWQDFMFACANYRLTKDFEENILAELKEQIRRLAHHASLGLWCGNNEMEMFAAKGEWGANDEIRVDYLKMYEDLFPKLLKEEDSDRFYWPASPSSGGGFDEPNDPDRGDVHYWDVWHGNKPFTEYRKFYFRYLSEFGFQSFPSIRTIESFTLPEDRNVFSYVMEKHQRNASANGKIMNYMEQMFLYPNDLDTLIYASQLLQAEAIKYGVEHFRRNRGRCMGTVYWQLNDCWPVASWSSIDYYGRWKALHYYAKRFFAPFMISCEEEGLLSQTLNTNAEPFEVKKSIRLNVTNESMQDRRGLVKWQLRKSDGRIIRESKEEVVVPALSSLWLKKEDMKDADIHRDYVSYQLIEAGNVVSEGTVLFSAPKHFTFVDPKLRVRVEGDEIIVSAAQYAKSVEVRNVKDDLILSDNFFDLNGGEKRVKVISGETDGLEVRSVYSIR